MKKSIAFAVCMTLLTLIMNDTIIVQHAQEQASADKKARAEELLREARKALGGEDKFGAVQGFQATGKFRGLIGDINSSGEMQYSFMSPDKFMQTDTMTFDVRQIKIGRVMNGDDAWRVRPSSSGGGVMVFNPSGKPGDAKQIADAEKLDKERLVKEMRAESARLHLAYLLAAPAGATIEFTYVGEAEAPDGRADVIDARGLAGSENFTARLFLDRKTRRPLMLSYRGLERRTVGMSGTIRSGSAGSAAAREKMIEEARKQVATQPQEEEVQLRFADYKQVGGIMLPHFMTETRGGKVSQEFEVIDFKINPSFKPDMFRRK